MTQHLFTPKSTRPIICGVCGGMEITRDHGFDMAHALITRATANGIVALDADGNKLGFPGVADDEKGHRFAAQGFCAHMHWNLNVRRGLIAADGWSWVVPA